MSSRRAQCSGLSPALSVPAGAEDFEDNRFRDLTQEEIDARVLDIAEKSNLGFPLIQNAACTLQEHGLLSELLESPKLVAGAAVNPDTAIFGFGNPSSTGIEAVVRLGDTRPFANRFDVYFGSMTDVPLTVTVIDKATGTTLWRVERPTPAVHESPDAYTTPALLRYGNTTEIVITGGGSTRTIAVRAS